MLTDIRALADQFLIAFPNINNDERIAPGVRDPVWVVTEIEGDGIL